VAFVTATRSAQAMDSTGVMAAAYAITVQQYSLGLVIMLAIQATGATLVPSALSNNKASSSLSSSSSSSSSSSGSSTDESGENSSSTNDNKTGSSSSSSSSSSGSNNRYSEEGIVAARRIGDRLIGWATLIAASMAVLQVAALPVVTPLFSTLPEVRSAVKAPALMAALVQFTNGYVRCVACGRAILQLSFLSRGSFVFAGRF
jgi:hypothetical protein